MAVVYHSGNGLMRATEHLALTGLVVVDGHRSRYQAERIQRVRNEWAH